MSRYDDDIWRLVPVEAGAPAPHLVRFVRDLGEPESALDLGCGDGRLTTELRARELVAADVSEVALERASARLPSAELVKLAPDEPLPMEDGSFDLVLCAETIEHVRDVQLLLSEVRRVLRPGGGLAVTTPAHGRLTGLDILVRGFERHFHPMSPHLRFLTARSLAGLLDEMGFDPGTVRREAGTLTAVARR
jgi:ubiquinone/menaquinone biosynthesis C-methylase UbiE